jgi:hypothetical protein
MGSPKAAGMNAGPAKVAAEVAGEGCLSGPGGRGVPSTGASLGSGCFRALALHQRKKKGFRETSQPASQPASHPPTTAEASSAAGYNGQHVHGAPAPLFLLTRRNMQVAPDSWEAFYWAALALPAPWPCRQPTSL